MYFHYIILLEKNSNESGIKKQYHTLFNAHLCMPPKKASWTVLYYGNKEIFVAEMPYFCWVIQQFTNSHNLPSFEVL